MSNIHKLPRVCGLALALSASLAILGCAENPTKPKVDQATVVPQLLASGAQLEQRGDLNGALVDYVKALALKSDDAEAYYRVGRVQAALGNPSTAQDAYSHALALNPAHVGALEGLGIQQLQQGHSTEAMQLLQQAVTRDSRRWHAWNGLGVISDLKGDHRMAQAYFERALGLHPDDPELLNNMAFSLYLSNNYPRARGYLERAITIRPSYTKAWSNLGLLLARSGDYDHAVEAFEHVTEPASARYNVAYVCMLDGKLAVAETLLHQAIKISPTYNAAAYAALEHVRSKIAGDSGAVPGPLSWNGPVPNLALDTAFAK